MMVSYKSNLVLTLPVQTQHFPFFPVYINYIFQNADPAQLLKLYRCCKYFYFKLQITVSSKIWYRNYPNNDKIIFVFPFKNGKNEIYRFYQNVEKLWLTDELRITEPSISSALIGEEFLYRIYRNNLKKLSIDSKFTLLTELRILSKSPDLTEVELQTIIKNENEERIPIEEIMVLFPNIKHFVIFPTHVTVESFNKLLKFNFSNKINVLKFWHIETEFDPISFCNFLEENLDDDPDVFLMLRSLLFELRVRPQIEEIINGWERKKPKDFFV